MFLIARRHLLAALLAAAAVIAPLQACYALYPEQLIKIIVTFPPGGSSDTSSARSNRSLRPI